MAIVAILASIALPAYNSYVFRSRIPAGLDALTAYQTRMEQRYQDLGHYANVVSSAPGTACGVTAPVVNNFTVTCALSGPTGSVSQGYTATVTGSGAVAGVKYTVDNAGVRKTVTHPKGVPAKDCWSVRGATCDA